MTSGEMECDVIKKENQLLLLSGKRDSTDMNGLEKEKNKFPCWDFAHGMERSSLGGSSSGELCQQTWR